MVVAFAPPPDHEQFWLCPVNYAQSAAGLEGIIWPLFKHLLLTSRSQRSLNYFFFANTKMEEKIRHDLETVNS